jgi:hypothetical protein
VSAMKVRLIAVQAATDLTHYRTPTAFRGRVLGLAARVIQRRLRDARIRTHPPPGRSDHRKYPEILDKYCTVRLFRSLEAPF